MGDLVKRESTVIKSIPLDEKQFALAVLSIQTSEQASQFLNNLRDAKAIVNNVKMYEHLRRKFSILENQAYLELYERGFHTELRKINGSLVAACKWVMSRKGKKKDDLISGEYGPILRAYKHYRNDKEKEKILKRAKEYKDHALTEFNSLGQVTIGADSLQCWIGEHVSSDIAHDLVDGVKDALLNAGAYGVGNGRYCKIENEYDLRDAITIRVESITKDFISILKLCHEAKENGIHTPKLLINWDSQGRWMLSPESFVYLYLIEQTNCDVEWCFASEKVRNEFKNLSDKVLEVF